MMTGLLVGLVGGLVIAAGMAWYFYSQPSGFKVMERAPEIAGPDQAAKPEKTTPPPVEAPGIPAPQSTGSEPTAPKAPAAGKPAAPAGKPGDAPQSAYSFYDILPGKAAPKPLEPPKPKEYWWLQVAALKSQEDADRLKAKLTLLNLDTVIGQTQAAGQTLYRVRVGPFRSEDAAMGALDTLAVNNFEPRLLKEAVNP